MRVFLSFVLTAILCVDVLAAPSPSPRGLFVTVIQEPPVLASRQAIIDLVDYAHRAGVVTLFVQVYRANQAWFPSLVADASPYTECLKSTGEDPLALLIKTAHARGIQVHAWVNLLSLSRNTKAPLLKKFGPEILTRTRQKKKVLDDYMIDNQFFLEPGDPRVVAELSRVLVELLTRYKDVDGIQFDYIRYPDQNPHYGYNRMNMDRYKAWARTSVIEEGSRSWQDWKRSQVTGLLRRLVTLARTIHPGIQVSTTGCSPGIRALDEAFQDWPRWVNSGLTDFVTVMTYAADPSEFSGLMDDARARVNDPDRIHFAIGAYMNAGSPLKFADQVRRCEAAGRGMCVVFHYGSLLGASSLGDVLLK
jgi:uncharacterized lipoprotein YddW (UPF0748 family)